MKSKKLWEGIYWVGAEDWDRRLFDSLIPLPDGTSYNAYLVQGREKTVLIDAVDPGQFDRLREHLQEFPRIDYLIANHLEQDHSGLIPYVLEKYPEARLLLTPSAVDLALSHLHLDDNRIQTVADGETLDLGGRTIRFIHFPWVHWPETMLSYLQEDRILFSCDLFGSHLTSTEFFLREDHLAWEPAKRYFAEIMMPFRKIIQKNLNKVESLELAYIAPSHGPIYSRPQFIIEAYKKWIADQPENLVVIAHVTMHGSTQKLVARLIKALAERNIQVQPFNLPVTDTGKLAMSLVDAATIVVASPTVLTGLHPLAAGAVFLVNALRPKALHAGFIGSYGWKSRALEQLKTMLDSVRFEFLSPVQIKGDPDEAALKLVDNLAEEILQKHRAAGLL
ncbi:MAG: FprA family A-type flavoprotein [Candidatus Saccharicenans sp.]|nr:FprA family A-type flavoprotein [Candidatus Saccharicenans sp.]MDH7492824.1 FprA family A-type flavoprotein [Candidatus Saccharicenans sp.]